MLTGTAGMFRLQVGARARVRLAGGWPISTAMACSSCERVRSRSTALAWADLSWVWAVSTSLRAPTPTL